MNCVVCSPVYSHVDVICDDGTGPVEEYCDVCLVLGARTRREAKWAAWGVWKAQGTKHADYAQSDHTFPLTGMRVEPWPDEDDADALGGDDFDDAVRSWRPFVADLRVKEDAS